MPLEYKRDCFVKYLIVEQLKLLLFPSSAGPLAASGIRGGALQRSAELLRVFAEGSSAFRRERMINLRLST